MKKIKNLFFIIIGILIVGFTAATLNIQTTIQNAVVYIKTLFITQDGSPGGIKTVIINGEEGNIRTKGDINSSGNITIENTLKVNGDVSLPNDSINTNEIADNAITSEKIANGTIQTEDIADNAITSEKILDGNIKTQDLTDNSITSSKIVNGAVTSEKIADNSINSNKIINGSIQTEDLANGSITEDKLAENSVSTNALQNGAVTNEKIADNSITSSKIKDYSITTNKISTGAITNNKLADNSVNSRTLDENDNYKMSNLSIKNNLYVSGNTVLSGITEINNKLKVTVNKPLDSNPPYYFLDYFEIATFKNKATPLSNGDTRVLSITQDKDGSVVLRGVGRNIHLLPKGGNGSVTISGNVGIGTTDPQAKLDVNGDTNINGSISIKNVANIGGDTNIKGSLNVNGISNLNGDTKIGGNLIISGTISFTNPENIPWLNKQTNLPFVKFGNPNFIKPQILGAFDGQISPYSSRSYLFYEEDGSLIGLRNGYDGINYYMYYMYSKEGDYSNMTLTNMKYEPAFLQGTDEHVWWVIDGNENSLTVETADQNNNYKHTYIITNITTMDPSTHTPDKIIDITNIVQNDLGRPILSRGTPNYSCIYISEKKLVACTKGDRTQYLYLYKVNPDKTLTRIDLFNTIENQTGDIFFDATNKDYLIFTGQITNGIKIRGDHTQTPNLQYYIDGNYLYLQTLRSSYLYTGNIVRQITYNIIYKIDLTNNKVYYENQFPLVFDFYGYKNMSKDPWSLATTYHIRFKNFKPYFFKKKGFVLVAWKRADTSTNFVIQKYGTFDNFLEYFKGFRGRGDYTLRPDGTSAYIGGKTYYPYDASYLGKSVSYTLFIKDNKLITKSTSYKYGEGLQTKWLKLTLPNDKLESTIPVGLPPSQRSGLNIPTRIEDISSTNLWKIKTTSIDTNGNIIGYYEENGNIYKYNSTDESINLYKTLPSNYIDIIQNDIKNDPEYKDPTYGDPVRTVYLIEPVDDNRLLVSYAFQYNIDDYNRLLRYKWLLYSYDNNSLKLLKRSNKREVKGVIRLYDQKIRLNNVYKYMVSYKNNDGITYLRFNQPYKGKIAGNRNHIRLVKLDSNNNILEDKIYDGYPSWGNPTIGIHPLYGPYKTRSFDDSKSKTKFRFEDNTDISDLNNRLTQCFEDMINGKTRKYGVMTTVRQAEGFIVYTSETPLFINGLYTTIHTNMYDLTDPKYGLVTTTGDTTPLKNKTIYVYVDPNQDLTNPSLSFSFSEPPFPVIAILQTDDYGIKQIIIKDGLDITAPTVYVKKINISNYIEMKGADGNRYKIYIDSSGNLKVEKIEGTP